jgi:hypothetical protein
MKNIFNKNGLRIISAALLLFAGSFAAMPSFADEANNVKLDIYTFSPDFLYPERNPDTMTFCATTYTANIQADWGGDDILGCGNDFVAIHYTGTMTFTSDVPVYLMAIADDGFSMTLDGVSVIEDWSLKGCGGSVNAFTPIANHSYVLDAWFYEYGGGACSTLYMLPLDGASGWDIVQPSAFTQPVVEPTPEPTVEPSPEPSVEPSPEPTQPSPEPSPEPETPSPEPSPEPTEPPVTSSPEPQLSPEPVVENTIEPEPTVVEIPSTEPPVENIEEPIITQEELVAQLAEEAEADDPQVPEELASIPLIGNAAVAVLEAFNALGNLGADMAPEVRAKSEKVVVGAIIAGQIAQVAAASSVAASASTRKNK